MSEDLGDREVEATIARNLKQRRFWLLLYAAIWAPVNIAAGVFAGLHPKLSPGGWWVFAAISALFFAGFLLLERRLRLPASFWNERVVAGRIDKAQRGRAILLWLSVLLMFCGAPAFLLATEHQLDRNSTAADVFHWLEAAAFLVVGLAAFFGVGYDKPFKTALNDELTRALRAKALHSGFFVLLAGAFAAYLVGLTHPRLTVLAMPLVIMGSIAAATIHFAILDRRAAGPSA